MLCWCMDLWIFRKNCVSSLFEQNGSVGKKTSIFLKVLTTPNFLVNLYISITFLFLVIPWWSPSLIGLPTLKDLISTLSRNGLKHPWSLSVNLIIVSSGKKSEFIQLPSYFISQWERMRKNSNNKRLWVISNALHQITLKIHRLACIVYWPYVSS